MGDAHCQLTHEIWKSTGIIMWYIIVFEESEAYGAYPILLVSSFKVQVQVKILFGGFTYSG